MMTLSDKECDDVLEAMLARISDIEGKSGHPQPESYRFRRLVVRLTGMSYEEYVASVERDIDGEYNGEAR